MSGKAHLAPIAAGKLQPSEPAQPQLVLLFRLRLQSSPILEYLLRLIVPLVHVLRRQRVEVGFGSVAGSLAHQCAGTLWEGSASRNLTFFGRFVRLETPALDLEELLDQPPNIVIGLRGG